MQYFELLRVLVVQILLSLDSFNFFQRFLRDLLSNFSDEIWSIAIDYHNLKLVLNELKVLLIHHFLVE
jgi:hypothetical protein